MDILRLVADAVTVAQCEDRTCACWSSSALCCAAENDETSAVAACRTSANTASIIPSACQVRNIVALCVGREFALAARSLREETTLGARGASKRDFNQRVTKQFAQSCKACFGSGIRGRELTSLTAPFGLVSLKPADRGLLPADRGQVPFKISVAPQHQRSASARTMHLPSQQQCGQCLCLKQSIDCS